MPHDSALVIAILGGLITVVALRLVAMMWPGIRALDLSLMKTSIQLNASLILGLVMELAVALGLAAGYDALLRWAAFVQALGPTLHLLLGFAVLAAAAPWIPAFKKTLVAPAALVMAYLALAYRLSPSETDEGPGVMASIFIVGGIGLLFLVSFSAKLLASLLWCRATNSGRHVR